MQHLKNFSKEVTTQYSNSIDVYNYMTIILRKYTSKLYAKVNTLSSIDIINADIENVPDEDLSLSIDQIDYDTNITVVCS